MASPSTNPNRDRRAMAAVRDFALVPLVVVAGFAALAALSITADQSRLAGLAPIRGTVSHFISAQAASTTLQAVATGLVTVTSITFSVLLLAVQQTASNLSPVVFDQFARRKGNQALVGFFVGLVLYAYTVLALQTRAAPILGAAMATALTVFAMLFLLVVIYTTINQMRPTNVLRQIHTRALSARAHEKLLVDRTRRIERAEHPIMATYCAESTGYLNEVRLRRLERVAASPDAIEVVLHKAVGDFVARGDLLVTVRAADPDLADQIAPMLPATLTVGTQRDLDHDPTTGIDQLGNIAWTSGSSARQNPEIAREAVDLLRDLATRLFTEEHPANGDPSELPVVYPEHDSERLIEVLLSILVVAHESQQHMTAARVLAVYVDLLSITRGANREALVRSVETAKPLLDDMPATPMLLLARTRLSEALQS